MKTKVLLIGSAAILALPGASAQSWQQITPPLSMNYPRISCSADGATLLLSGERLSIPVYLSTNSGAAWTTSSAPVGTWGPFSISVDKSRFLAASYYQPGGMYTSTDGGITWTSNNVPNAGWTSVAGSADGQRLVAVNNSPETIYTSTNGGSLWTQATNAPAAIWQSVASSADGNKLVAANNYPGTIYTSTNGGVDWRRCTNVPAANWTRVVSSADGNRLITMAGKIYTSADSGDTWTKNSLPEGSWRDCALSADATTIIVGSQSGLIFTSTDSGATWISNSVPVRPWNSVVLSADGSQFFAVADGPSGGIWRSISVPAPRLQAALSPGGYSVGWVLPSINFVLQQSGDSTSTSWEDITNVPTLNLSNLRYEVALPMTDRGFFRLKSQ